MADNLGSLGTAFIDIVARQDQLNNQFNSIQNKAKSVANTIGVTLGAAGLLAGFKALISSASEFERTFTGVRKTVDASEQEFGAISSQIRNLAKTIPVAVTELNNIAEAGGQLGIQKQNIVAFTETIARLAATTNLSSDQAATSIAQFINVMGTSQSQISNIGSAISGLGNISAATETDIVNMAQRLASSGHLIGLSESQVLGLATSLSEVGIEAEAGGTAFSKLFRDMATAVAKGGSDLTKFAEVALPGVTNAAEKFATMFRTDAAGAIVAFIKGLDSTHMSGEKAILTLQDLGITESRMTNAIQSVASASDRLNTNLQNSARFYKENNATLKESERAFSTFDAKMTLLKSSVNDLAITVGTKLLPPLARGADALRVMIEEADRGEGPIVNLTAAVIALTAAMAVGKIVAWGGAIGTTVKEVFLLETALGAAAGATGTLTIAVGLLQKVLLAAAPPAALIAGLAVVAYKSYEIGNAIHQVEEAEISKTEAENRAWNSTMRAINTLKQHNIVIDTQGKSLAQLQIEIGKYGQELGKAERAETSAAKAATDAAAAKIKAANEAAAKNKELSDKEKERLKDLREGFMESLKPADDLNKKIAELGKGFSDTDIVSVYADEIIDAANAQREHGYAVTGTVAKLLPLAQMFKLNIELVKSLNDEMREFKVPEIDLSKLLPKDFGDPNAGIEVPIQPKLGKTAYEGVKKIEEMKNEVQDLNDAVIQLSNAGYSAAQIQKILGSEISNAAKYSKDYGVQLLPVVQGLVDQKEAAERSVAEAQEWQKVWSQATANLVTDFVHGISDIVFKGKSIGAMFKDIGLQAGKSFFDSFLMQATKPINKLFDDWGKKLSDVVGKALGGLWKSIGPKIGNFLGLGGTSIGAALGLGGGAAAAGAGAGAAAGGAGAAAGAGGAAGSTGLIALATNPITIAAAAAIGSALLIKKFVGRGRRTANEFVQSVQNPFGQQLSGIVDAFDAEKKAGTLTTEKAEEARNALAELIDSFNAAGTDFAKQGGTQSKVWQQAVTTMTQNFGAGFSRIFDSWDATIQALKQQQESAADAADDAASATTTPTNPLRVLTTIPATGLATSASQIFAAAVSKFEQVVTGLPGASGPSSVQITVPIEIANTFEFDQAIDPKMIRDTIIPEITDVLETGVRGIREKWTVIFRDTLDGLTVMQPV